MPSVCLYFKVHQPYRLKKYTSSEIEKVHCCEDAKAGREYISNIAEKCYLPSNKLLLDAINAYSGNFKVAFSISGVTVELLQKYRPDVIDSFKALVNTGCVEMLGETYYHSLSSLYSKKEFQRQVQKQNNTIKEVFGITPVLFRNTELIYNNTIAETIAALGFKGILCEGLNRILQGKSANQLYTVPGMGNDFAVLLRNISLSDDIAFRFGEEHWEHYPLTSEKFAEWIHQHEAGTQAINIFLDYETAGLHKNKSTGIFDFLKALPGAVLENKKWKFSTPSEVLKEYYPKDKYDVPQTISWKDQEKTSCVWCENMMQNNTLKKIYSLENIVQQSNDETVKSLWGRLQAADYFYYMAAQEGNDERYANPYKNSEEVYECYRNIATGFEIALIQKALKTSQNFYTAPVGILY